LSMFLSTTKITVGFTFLINVFVSFPAMVMGEKRVIKALVTAPAKPNRFAPEPTCKITVTNPKGRNFEPKVDKTPQGFETFFTSNEPGPHVFKIEYNGKEIPDSPITCEVEKLEARKVEVRGLETRKSHTRFLIKNFIFRP